MRGVTISWKGGECCRGDSEIFSVLEVGMWYDVRSGVLERCVMK